MFTAEQLISREYLGMQRILHASPRGYGGRGNKWAGIILQVAIEHDAGSILDYGCGQGTLAAALRLHAQHLRIAEYDPAIPEKAALPEFADVVSVTDVLEHIEPERLGRVLEHIKALSRKAVFCVISTKTSNKTLPDGRNAHLIIESPQWWKARLKKAGFTLHRPPTVVRTVPEKEYVVVLTP